MDSKKSTQNSATSLLKKTTLKSKPKSLRPMRSMVAIRSLKSKTHVASFNISKDDNESVKI